jgi:uncharacterized membrane protein YjjP (DUF1212 family)
MLAMHVAKKKISLIQAKIELDTIIRTPSRYSWMFKIFCFGLSSGSIAPLFFGAGWVETVLSFLLGAVVGALCWGKLNT